MWDVHPAVSLGQPIEHLQNPSCSDSKEIRYLLFEFTLTVAQEICHTQTSCFFGSLSRLVGDPWRDLARQAFLKRHDFDQTRKKETRTDVCLLHPEPVQHHLTEQHARSSSQGDLWGPYVWKLLRWISTPSV